MKRILIAVFAVTLSLTMFMSDAEARRLGGGSSFGMNRSVSPMRQSAPPAKPATPAPSTAPSAQPATVGAAAPRSSLSRWMGPIAGLAAGLGIAALLSHFGMGEGMANFVMIALLAMAAIAVLRMIFRPRQPQGGMQYAGGAPGTPRVEPAYFDAAKVSPGGGLDVPPDGLKVSPGGTAPADHAAPAAGTIPTGFDVEGFLRQAKLNFVRLQAANDRGDMNDIAQFTSPEVFAEIQMQYRERNQAPQQTDVVTLNADLLEVAEENKQYIASVRYFGQLREEKDAAPAAFDEIWHLAKPVDGSRGWQVAGIQQVQ